jgi:hypothetical protein
MQYPPKNFPRSPFFLLSDPRKMRAAIFSRVGAALGRLLSHPGHKSTPLFPQKYSNCQLNFDPNLHLQMEGLAFTVYSLLITFKTLFPIPNPLPLTPPPDASPISPTDGTTPALSPNPPP